MSPPPPSRRASSPTGRLSSAAVRRPILPLGMHLAFCVASASADHPTPLFGYQSGGLSSVADAASVVAPTGGASGGEDHGDSYPGSMRYDPENGLVYIAGATYGKYFNGFGAGGGATAWAGEDGGGDKESSSSSDCFLAVLKVPDATGDDDGIGERRKLGRSMLSTAARDPNAEDDDPSSRLEVIRALRIGTASNPEACSSLTALPSSSSSEANKIIRANLALIGHTEEGGLMTGLREVGSRKAKAYGWALNVNLEMDLEADQNPEGGAAAANAEQVTGGRLFHESAVQYPAAIAAPPPPPPPGAEGEGPPPSAKEGDVIYVVLLDTDDESLNPKYSGQSFKPDLIAGMDPQGDASEAEGGGATGTVGEGTSSYHRYGKKFDLRVMKLSLKSSQEITADEAQINRHGGPDYPLRENMKVLWEMPYATADNNDGSHEGVLVADLLYVPDVESKVEDSGNDDAEGDFLLLAGSTRGYGSAFGSELQMEGDWDGFLTKLNPSTGEELKPLAAATQEDMLRAAPHSVRIRSENGMDDLIRGVCVPPNAGGPRDAFVVGSTRGVFDAGSIPGGRDAAGGADPMDPPPPDAGSGGFSEAIEGREDCGTT